LPLQLFEIPVSPESSYLQHLFELRITYQNIFKELISNREYSWKSTKFKFTRILTLYSVVVDIVYSEEITDFSEVASFIQREELYFVRTTIFTCKVDENLDFDIFNKINASADASNWNDGLSRIDLNLFQGGENLAN